MVSKSTASDGSIRTGHSDEVKGRGCQSNDDHGSHAANPSVALDLLHWYDRHARSLPWRTPPQAIAAGTRPDAYRVWLSEIMLQQTTVAAVKGYFALFTDRWPNVTALAAAEDQAVMGAWAGLGYYARARNLLACARKVVNEHGGRFPPTEAGLKALPGIGDYTAAAIASIAFGERAAVVDGNVERVITRLFAIEAPLPRARPLIRHEVDALTPAARPGDFAQAMMDLGATVCTPRKPACVVCPVSSACAAREEGRQDAFPVKLAKKAKPSRVGACFVARRADGALWLRRRPPTGMLGGMAEPPSTGWSARADGALGPDAAPFPAAWELAGAVAHGFTHFDLTLEVWSAPLMGDPPGEGWWSTPERLAGEALPTLMRKAIERAVGSLSPHAPVAKDPTEESLL